MMTSDSLKEYVARNFSLDCPRMVLRGNAGPDDLVFEGPGTIYLSAEGELLFKLFAGGRPSLSLFALVAKRGLGRPGEIIARDKYLGLSP